MSNPWDNTIVEYCEFCGDPLCDGTCKMSTRMNERAAVYEVTVKLLSDELDTEIDETNSNIRGLLTHYPEWRPTIRDRVAIKLNCSIEYATRLVDNWLRKDRRFNGDAMYNTGPKSIACQCGAIHTSNPDHHSDWCPMYKPTR